MEGGAKMFGVFRVKNHDFTQKNHIFSNCGGRRENFWGISFEKSRFYAKKSYFFPILGGGVARRVRPPPGSAPGWKSRSWLGTDTNMWWVNTPLLITGSLTAMNIHVCWFFILSPLLFYLCSFHFWNWTLKRHQRCLLI